MQIQHDYSYGVIPFFKAGETWNVFLINQYGHKGDVYWTFPKGHAEKEETPIEAALRELHEETGITIAQLSEETYTQEYTFVHEGVEIHKVVVYYKGFASSEDFSIQADEVKEAGWFALDSALAQLTFDAAKTLLQDAAKTLPS